MRLLGHLILRVLVSPAWVVIDLRWRSWRRRRPHLAKQQPELPPWIRRVLQGTQTPQEDDTAEKQTRRRFTAEFKQAVKHMLEGGKGLTEVATELEVSTGQLSTWRTEHLAAGSAEALAARKAEEAEMQQLKREVKRLEEKNLILKKATAFSTKESA